MKRLRAWLKRGAPEPELIERAHALLKAAAILDVLDYKAYGKEVRWAANRLLDVPPRDPYEQKLVDEMLAREKQPLT